MPPCISRLFQRLRGPKPEARAGTRQTDLHGLRSALLVAVEDCTGLPAQHLQLRIRCASTRRDLWLLRSDAYHLIAMSHCQSVADERIAQLLHLFEDRVAPQWLGRTP